MTIETEADPRTQAFLARIERIDARSKPQWGKLDAARMLAHCAVAVELALGVTTLPRSILGRLIGGFAKKKLLSEKPFDRDLPTDRRFLVPGGDLAAERTRLAELVLRFGARRGRDFSRAPHPFFGQLTDEEWSELTWKHLDHHLGQFGV